MKMINFRKRKVCQRLSTSFEIGFIAAIVLTDGWRLYYASRRTVYRFAIPISHIELQYVLRIETALGFWKKDSVVASRIAVEQRI